MPFNRLTIVFLLLTLTLLLVIGGLLSFDFSSREYFIFIACSITILSSQWWLSRYFIKSIQDILNYSAISTPSHIMSMRDMKAHYLWYNASYNDMKKLNHELEIKTDYFDWLINLMPNYMLVLNSEFDVIQCNNKFSHLVHDTCIAIVGKKIEAFGFGELKEKLLGHQLWLLEDGIRLGTFEWLHIDDKERTRYIAWYCSYDKDRQHYILLGADISAVKESQHNMLKMKERAEAASLAKSTFLATMSHEIRTPLNGVIGMVDLLHYELLDKKHCEMIDTVSLSAGHLLAIINDILDFSKIESGHLLLEVEPFDLIDMLTEVGATFRLSAYEKKINLVFLLEQEVPTLLTGDSVRFKQILTNLISNALKFTISEVPWQGYIRLKIECFDINEGKVGLLFRVEDNGIGIDEKKLHCIFQPFEQEESSITRKFGGTGLGLSITSRLCQAMDGDIWVLSNKGEGTEFTCYLPLTLRQDQNSYFDYCLFGKKCVLFTRNQFVFQELEACILALSGSLDWFEVVVDASCYDHIFIFDEPEHYFKDVITACQNKVILLCCSIENSQKHDVLAQPYCQILPLDFRQLKSLLINEPQNVVQTGKKLLLDLDQHARVLLVEDYEINRKVILAQLIKLGVNADCTENGKSAWQILQKKSYDLILTDCHMPVMDGYELTKKIRNSDNKAISQMTVIAITANAIKGEREICLSAGMDDYLTKPIKINQLRDKLANYISCQGALAIQQVLSGSLQHFDPKQLTEIIGDDEALKYELLQDYLLLSTQALIELNSFYKQQDFSALAGIAHKLKSPSKGIGAHAVFLLCEQVELQAKHEDLTLVSTHVRELNISVENLQQEVNHYISIKIA